MRTWILLLSLIFISSNDTRADIWDLKLLEIDKFDLEYTKLNPDNRDPYAPEYTGKWRERVAAKFNLNILETAYWDNNVHTETIQSGPVKTVGWQWEAGFHVWKYFDIFHTHHSRHIMDEPSQRDYHYGQDGTSNQFPVEDGFGIRVRFIQRDK